MSEDHYLAGLDLRDRRVVFIGGGGVAQRRLPRLIAAGARVELIAPEVTVAVSGMIESGEVSWQRRGYAEGDLDGAWYAIAASSDPEVNVRVVEEAQRRRVFCVRSDLAAAGTAVTPAIGEHDGMVLGVLAGGAHRRSAAVRDVVLEALRTGALAEAGELGAKTAGVVLVGAGPGDPDLITVAGRRELARADLVVADRLAPRALLDELSGHVEIVDAAKIPYGRAATQQAINTALIEGARAGQRVVRLKGGDSFVFGRGFEEVLACAEEGIAVTVIPGVTSAFSAPASAGIPVTHRGVTHEVVVVSGHVGPADESSLVDWPSVARLRGTLVLMMAMQRLGEFAEVLMANGKPGDTPAAVIADGATRNQRVLRSTVAQVAAEAREQEFTPPAIVVIGEVAGFGA
ncbi:uroporphyrinogen-III C-methyltransferase [Sciscionella marina]|uniref:uroporphyrinogen-III C-methyltransferase n=1 Tax=Sciscionella marina TaxID=508770 RepID=UPI00037F85A4|nr:uroporphyrinogen-III C-methyltransferase [Sciscionella marina]